jgi:sodium/hydrogen exchanger 8
MVDSNDNNSTYYNQDSILNSDDAINLYFVIFLSLLAVVLVMSKFLHDRPKLASILPEAGLTIIIGTISGYFIYSYADNQDPKDDDGVSDQVTDGLLSFSPTIFFFVLLPPIIFNSGFTIKREIFFRHIVPISLFACIGTAISTFVIALSLQFAKGVGLMGNFQPHFTELLTFGALISATDPVSTLAVFQVKRVNPQLFYLVFGESVLNDAIGLVLFNSFKKLVGKKDSLERVTMTILNFLLDFTFGFVGSMFMGIIVGILSAFFFKVVDMRSTPTLELSLFILIMYLPFFFAEMLNLSGIVTILFTGISARHYTTRNISETTEESIGSLLRLIAHLAETSIFLELGLSVFGLSGNFQWRFFLLSISACLIGRALHVYPLKAMYNAMLLRKESRADLSEAFSQGPEYQTQGELSDNFTLTPSRRKDLKIQNNTAHMIWFSGLRGAVAYACANNFPDVFGHRQTFVFTTMAIVLFTVFVFGCTTEFALNILEIETNVNEDEYMEEHDTVQKMSFLSVLEHKFINSIVDNDNSVEMQDMSYSDDLRMFQEEESRERNTSTKSSQSLYDFGLGGKSGLSSSSPLKSGRVQLRSIPSQESI